MYVSSCAAAQFPPPCMVMHVMQQTFVVIFLRSMRPVLCLLKRPTKSKKYRAERPHFVEFYANRFEQKTTGTLPAELANEK